MHEVASGVHGSAWDFRRGAKLVAREEVVVIKFTYCFCSGRVVIPWLGSSEYPIEGGFGSKGNGDVQREINL